MPGVSLLDSVTDLMGTSPSRWPARIEFLDRARNAKPYLVLAHVRELTLPKTKSYRIAELGRLTLLVRLLSHEGQVLCEGQVRKAFPRDPQKYSSERSVLNYALAASTMLDLCDRMGDGYCASLGRWAGDPDAAPPAPPAASSGKPAVKAPPRRR